MFDARERHGHGHDRVDVGQPPDRDGIFDAEFSRRTAEGSRDAAGLRLARIDGEEIGAELRELLENVAPGALADRGQQDDRGNPDSNAECRQKGAQPMGAQRMQGKAERVSEAHLPLNAITGSSRAAREAGSRLAMMPVMRAVDTPATLAHTGGQAGRSG